ncbi:MAG TPA: M48 family metalloprotease [Caulobacteraceae bacterium]
MSPRLHSKGRWLRVGLGVAATLSLALSPVAAANAQDQGDALNILRDTEIEGILHQEMDPIFAAANIDPARVELYIVGDREMNAETGAGYHMIVTTGLIMQATTPNQLQGVLAHETGHMERGDVAHSGEMMHSAIAPMVAALGLGLLAALAGAPDAAAGLMYSSQYFAELNVLTYSREQESRADEAAITYLERAGYSAQGLVDFFNTFRFEEVFDDEKKYPYFRDHPLSDDRIEALSVRARQQAHYGVQDTPEMIAQFQIMKDKIKAFTNRPYQTFIDFPETDTSFAARYARAIAYYRELETDKAMTAIDALIAEKPDDPYLYELKGQALLESGRATEGEAPLRQAVALKPDAPLIRLLLAEDLISEDDHRKLDDAIVNLNRSLVVEPDSPLAWQYLSEAYDAKGDEGMARLAAAEQNFNLGQMKDARAFAMRAREYLKKGTPEWNRATDIVLTSDPSPDDLKLLGQQG